MGNVFDTDDHRVAFIAAVLYWCDENRDWLAANIKPPPRSTKVKVTPPKEPEEDLLAAIDKADREGDPLRISDLHQGGRNPTLRALMEAGLVTYSYGHLRDLIKLPVPLSPHQDALYPIRPSQDALRAATLEHLAQSRAAQRAREARAART